MTPGWLARRSDATTEATSRTLGVAILTWRVPWNAAKRRVDQCPFTSFVSEVLAERGRGFGSER